ncbi:bifunctional 3,4-dihydroxy-2-butanone-4-phosphate synthase/GTP cyclohydrolase II [Thiohalobacter sp. IOR34]|uniref:bifunctional 3,4-dihydroxy-2-butanone-4-phosphate synthase/GTP cyclohydrolase II n=1 Tax=Thiohalobacter sp. IOR34 TaxID=3057176 RepID=UPI0025AFDE4F|nr:bifunctional 3,4-dihydroxy-2-butanone-4-phosphate synthase/GTP cyclohydrolase II [Thiohalobacter sp. IOR34]WJW76220.1 bifunctional 3,4-dihydroxy-2-butanone-4-phosphate synthase/GTP cyclohydrolase II [Thiohalobacter sp. IOR34]
MKLNTPEELIEDIRQGRMVILMDDEDRENEGDLVMAATKVSADDINFMAKYGRGLICLTLTRERCRQLNLPLMVQDNTAQLSTAFTVSIEAAEGVTTGISAADRAVTVQTAVAPDARPSDIVMPGHVFPLMAQPGGVLNRAGHTEAGCDLARLAGLEPAAVIVEILNEDGTMARRPDLEKFAAEHGLKIGTIADLIHYRIENEKTVERVSECQLPTEFGEFRLIAFEDSIDQDVHLALIYGEVDYEQPVLVRVHVQGMLCDLLGATTSDCGWPLRRALQRVAEEGSGIVIVLGKPEDPQSLIRRIEHYREAGAQTALPKRSREELRTFGIGAQILADLGVKQMRVLSAPVKMHAIQGFGLEVVEYVPCD